MTERQFRLKMDLAASADAVWRALTQESELRRWFAPNASVRDGPGGEIRLEWDEDVFQTCAILEWAPRQHLALNWYEGAGPPTTIDFHVDGNGGASTLNLVHRGFSTHNAAALESISRGWTIETHIMRHYLQRFSGHDRYLRCGRVDLAQMDAGRWRALAQRLSMPDPAQLRQGQHFPIDMPENLVAGATLLKAIVDQDLLIELDALHGGLMRLSTEQMDGKLQLWQWVMTWNDQHAAVDQIFDWISKAVSSVAT